MQNYLISGDNFQTVNVPIVRIVGIDSYFLLLEYMKLQEKSYKNPFEIEDIDSFADKYTLYFKFFEKHHNNLEKHKIISCNSGEFESKSIEIYINYKEIECWIDKLGGSWWI